MRRAFLVLLCVHVGACTFQADTRPGGFQFLRDPSNGMCTPIPVCADGSSDCAYDGGMAPWADWEPCPDPCAGLDEGACAADPRCTPRYDDHKQFAGCDPRTDPDPCLGLDERTCSETPGC